MCGRQGGRACLPRALPHDSLELRDRERESKRERERERERKRERERESERERERERENVVRVAFPPSFCLCMHTFCCLINGCCWNFNVRSNRARKGQVGVISA